MRTFHASIMLCAILAAGSPALAEWGTTQGDASHDGYVPINVSASAPQLLWSAPGMLDQSGVAVGGGDLFFVTHQQGTNWSDSLVALNEQTGALAWKMSPATQTGDPAYANGTVYLQTASGLNQMLGWNAQTQTQVFSASYANQGNTYLAPVISNGTLYMGGGYYGGQVYAYNTATSGTNWVTNVPYDGSYGNVSPAVDANNIYTTGGGGSDLLIINKTTGALVSETGPHNESISGSPLLTGNGGLFYVQDGTGTYLDITNPTAPQVVWTMDNLSSTNAPAYANGTLYVASGWPDLSNTLYAIDAATGQVQWSIPSFTGYTNIIATDNVLFAAQGTSTVAISLQTHQVLWSVPITGTMAVSDNELFIASDGIVSAYTIAVPEPASLALLATAATTLLLLRRRSQNAGFCNTIPSR